MVKMFRKLRFLMKNFGISAHATIPWDLVTPLANFEFFLGAFFIKRGSA
jgi:hypothetical protein